MIPRAAPVAQTRGESPDLLQKGSAYARSWLPLTAARGIATGEVALAGGGIALEEDEQRLVRALQHDARRSFSDLARELDLPEKTVQRRVQDLLDRGIIFFSVVTDPAALGYSVGALIGVRVDGSQPLSTTVGGLINVTGVDYALVTAGRYDGIVEVLCRDQRALLDVVDRSFHGAPGIRELEVFPYLELFGLEFDWENAQTRGNALRSSTLLDDKDLQIINHLQGDPRMPFARLGKLAGTSESQARRRVQRMLQAGCMKISAVSDPRSVGFEAQAWVGIRCDVSQSPAEVGRRLAVMSSVTYAVACTGRYEIFAEIVCRDSAELAQIVDSSIRTISGVATIEIFLGLEVFHRPLLAAASPAASPRAV